MILQSFPDLVSPDTLTTSLAVFIMFFIVSLAFLGYKMQSAFVLFFMGLTIIVFSLVVLLQINFIYFWLVVLLSGLAVVVAGIERYMLRPIRTNG